MLLEIGVRRLVSAEFRTPHNEIAAAIFSIIGVTYAVLVAFVAVLVWDSFNKAKAASHVEAAVIQDVFAAADGFADPTGADLTDRLNCYTSAVTATERPAQAEGRVDCSGAAYLDELHRLALSLRPSDQAHGNLYALLLRPFTRLRDSRIVVIAGERIIIVFSSFLGAPNVATHLAMGALLAVSGS